MEVGWRMSCVCLILQLTQRGSLLANWSLELRCPAEGDGVEVVSGPMRERLDGGTTSMEALMILPLTRGMPWPWVTHSI